MFLNNRYELLDPIGRGGIATIFRGRDTHTSRVVAIKVLREVYSIDPKFVRSFQGEAKAMFSLQHPNIVQVYDYGQADDEHFIVLELVEGTDLRRYLRSRGILDTNLSMSIAHDVALGLGAAHRQSIIHRDLKPQDILLGRTGSIKLIDFGFGMSLNGRSYNSPELLQGEIVTPASDVYALGMVMYEMVTGYPPFDGDNAVGVAMQHIQDMPTPPRQCNPDITPSLEAIILRCIAKAPEMRFRDGSQLASALEALM